MSQIATWIDDESELLVQDMRDGFAQAAVVHARSIALLASSLHPDHPLTPTDVVEMTRDVVAMCHHAGGLQ